MFVILLKNGNGDSTRDSFAKYYIPFIEIKYFNKLIEHKSFFDQQVKNKQKTSKNFAKFKLYSKNSIGLFVSSKSF